MGQLEDLQENVHELEDKFEALLEYLQVEPERVYPDWESYLKNHNTQMVAMHWEFKKKN